MPHPHVQASVRNLRALGLHLPPGSEDASPEEMTRRLAVASHALVRRGQEGPDIDVDGNDGEEGDRKSFDPFDTTPDGVHKPVYMGTLDADDESEEAWISQRAAAASARLAGDRQLGADAAEDDELSRRAARVSQPRG